LVSKPEQYRIPYEEKLNPAQFEAVAMKEGPILVIAGAGSGKTRTLTYRVARPVEDGISFLRNPTRLSESDLSKMENPGLKPIFDAYRRSITLAKE